MAKVIIIFMLLMGVKSQFCSNRSIDKFKRPVNEQNIQSCIAQCLGLHKFSTRCKYSETSGNVIGEKCERKFMEAKRDKIIACSLAVWPDLEATAQFRAQTKQSAQICDFLLYKFQKKFDMNTKTLVETVNPEFMRTLINDALSLGTKPVLQLGSWGDENMSGKGFMSALGSEKDRADFLIQIITLVKKYKFGGIATFWFHPGCPSPEGKCMFKKDKDRVIGLANEVFKPLREMGLKTFFFMTVIYTETAMWLGDYISEILPQVDYFLPEVSNQAGSYLGNVEFDNSLSFSMNALLKHSQSLTNKEFLSKCLYHVKPRGKQYEALDEKKVELRAKINKNSKLNEEQSFPVYCQQLTNPNFTHVKNAREQNFAYNGKTVLLYDDVDSLKAKADYARERMAGMFVEDMTDDDWSNQCGCGSSPYLRTVAEVLKGGDCIFKPCF